MIGRAAATLGLVLLALPVLALAPDRSPRPPERGIDVVSQSLSGIRPRARPQSDPRSARTASLAIGGPDTSLRPYKRPDAIVEQALFKKLRKRKGSVCGNVEIQGEKVDRVSGKIKGCGIKDAVRITSVSGVALSTPALMDCPTAQALNQWVERGVKPAFRRRGPVVELTVAAHYACRTRNNQSGARLSEHGRGRAIDISAFTMKDGEVITVLKGWGQGTTQRPLFKVHKAACGPFGTVLGPNADRYHQDHFHLDTARYRSGPYCK